MRCSGFRRKLSAFLDDELDSWERKRMELHISECSDCRRETGKLREMIDIMGGMERPRVPAQLWEGTRRKLEAASEQPTRAWWFRMPKWSLAPIGAVAFTLLFYFLSSQLFLHKYEPELMPITAYLQEHALSYSQQVLPSNPLSELAIAQMGQVTEDTQHDESVSELDMLMEVHYGIYPTNGS